MIAFVRGVVARNDSDSVIVDNHGIGYRIYVANPMSLKLGEEVLLHTYEHIREDAQMLFGFTSVEEHDLFVRLISVKGIGPKTAMNALSVGGYKEMINAIETSNAVYLKSLPGIGAKAASQIVLDLKGKLVDSGNQLDTNVNLLDAIEALKSLGYKSNEVTFLLKELRKEPNHSVDEYVKMGLQLLAARKGV